MAVKFRSDLEALLRDLDQGGYRVESVEAISGACGRSVDIHLTNRVVVSWDYYTESIWAEGPATASLRTEKYLKRIYEGGWLIRLWALNRVRCLTAVRTFRQSVTAKLLACFGQPA
jgi:hypothetical protein